MSDSQTMVALNASVAANREALEKSLVTTDRQGHTQLSIPPWLYQQANVLAPQSVITQKDPNFTPGFTVIQLDPDPWAGDFYAFEWAKKPDKQQYKDVPGTGEAAILAPAKQGILKLANAMGIDFSTDPGGREDGPRVDVYLFGERITSARRYVYTSIGTVRRSDGTRAGYRAEKEWEPAKVALELEIAASKKSFLKNDDARRSFAREEFLRSWDFRARMCAAKAQNAVMRAATGLKQKYTPEEAARAFFLVTYNYTADVTDPNSARILASLVGADISNVYGSAAPALDAPAQVPVDVADEPTAPPDAADAAPLEVVETGVVEVATGDLVSAHEEVEAEIVTDEPGPLDEAPAAAAPAPESEPEAEPATGPLDAAELEELAQLGEYTLGVSKYKDRTLRDLTFGNVDAGVKADRAFMEKSIEWTESHPKAAENSLEAGRMMKQYLALLDRNGGVLP